MLQKPEISACPYEPLGSNAGFTFLTTGLKRDIICNKLLFAEEHRCNVSVKFMVKTESVDVGPEMLGFLYYNVSGFNYCFAVTVNN